MKKTIIILLILSLVSFFSAQAQNQKLGSPSITNFSRADYNAGTQNWGIGQDDQGIIYFANNKGLLEFDGTNWRTFSLPNGTIARSVNFDSDGRIYFGGQNEFGYLERNKSGKPIYKSLTHLIPEEFKSFEDIWEIFIHPNGIYFCSEKGIIFLKNGQIKIIKPSKERFESFFQLEDKIYIQSLKEGLFELQNDSIIPIPNTNIFQNDRIISILPMDNSQKLILTFSKGLYLMDDSGITPWNVSSNNFFKTHQAYCAIRLNDGKYAVGTPQNGLLIINNEGGEELHINKDKGLQNNTILSLMQDSQQNIWLGLDNGIDYAEINSPITKIRNQEGISGTGYASISYKGKLFFGTNQGLFFKEWNEKSDSEKTTKFKLVENGLGQVWSIDKVNGELIVGQHKGTSILKNEKLVPISNVQGAWKFMVLNSNPNYAIGGAYSGLYLYKKQIDNTGNENHLNWKLVGKIDGFNESARIFEEDSDGNIWVSHSYKGLYKIALANDFKSVTNIKSYVGSNGLPNELVINVVKVRNELIYTTPKGVFKYDVFKDQFIPHQDFIEIFGENRNYHRLIEDKLGNIWFSIDSEFGVIKVEEKGVFNSFKVKYFNQIQDDLVDGFEHIYAFNENHVFIGSEKGFAHYSPLDRKNRDFLFKILIRKVTNITHEDSTFYWGNPNKENYDFHYKMNDFHFSFSAPYFEKIGYLRYRFKLDGFENDWSDWVAKTEKEYTNLSPGKYNFKVQARNAYGQLSDEASFEFKINSPWFWSWYSKMAYLILALLGLYSFSEIISKREEKKTEAFKKEQTEKLELKEAEFEKEVKKSEGEIIKLKNDKLHTDIRHKNSQLASATMHLVQKSEILMKIKHDLLNIQSEATPGLKKKIQQITRVIESDIQLDDSWEQFETYFDQVHENFFKRLRSKFPELTPKDQKLCAYLRMNLTTKEIAPLLNISVRGVEISRYRLRKKLELNSEVNLVAFIMEV